jgi:hypothetical protein
MMNLAKNCGGLLIARERRRKESGQPWQIRTRAMALAAQLVLMRWQRSYCVPWLSQAVAESGERWQRPGEAVKHRGESPLQHRCCNYCILLFQILLLTFSTISEHFHVKL